ATPGEIIWRMTVCGLGFGFFNTPNNRAILTTAPPARTGGASGMQATARLLGQTLGAALVALVFGVFRSAGPNTTMLFAAVAAVGASAVSFSRRLGGGSRREKT
ncbi:MAG TPA: MFS transporter, partial [Acetobacteraceae bacterium]|nr:MFS transporter [Acetobacteraceae bacterium]